MIEIKFPADNKALALAIGQALTTYAGGIVATTTAPEALTTRPAGKTPELGAPYEEPETPKDESPSDLAATQEQPAASAPAEVDEKGVPFNANFCGKAAKPFYSSGKRQGQWKKRQGVDEGAYDDWYASELAKAAPPEKAEAPEVDAAAAFGKKTEAPAGPKDFGEFMAWFSEQQAAGNYEAEHMEKACQELGLTTLDLVSDPAKVKTLYEYLA